MPDFNFQRIREDFPILNETIYGKPLSFLDSGASTQKPQVVIDTISNFYETSYANIHRGIYKLSQDATETYEETREIVKSLINASSTKECIFLRGATEGINLVAQSYGRTFLKKGDEIILSELEHHSNIVPWQILAEERGLHIKVIPVNDLGELDLDAYYALLGPKTKLVAITHISNSIGTIVPLKKVIEMAHNKGAKVLVDGCQAVAHIPVDVQALDADFYVFSGHKIYGPTGIGVLYGKLELLEAMPPWQGGGDMIETVSFTKTTYNDLPHKFEAGTPNIAGGVGLGVAINYILNIGFENIEFHEKKLLDYANKKLKLINNLEIIGDSPNKAGIISFNIKGVHPHDLGTILDREGVAIRAGHHCAQPIMERFGVTATARMSLGIYNNEEDINRFINGIQKALEIFG
ncbi:MAG: aminotransferase class V-fold PLP-dependent enzyme [Sphingomonadales bacterium]|jgi:cysteine desulfurase/selenocysteine lyase